MTISVIIPTLNEQRTIAATLQHTRSLGFDEILVVDGGSTDHTRAIVDSLMSSVQRSADGTLRLLSSPPGRAVQLNVGGAAAGSDVLLFLHSDTYLPPSAKTAVQAVLADDLTVGGRFDVQFDSRSVWGYLISSLMNVRSRVTRIATGDQALFVRRGVFQQLGGFADIPLMEDIEFSRRLKRQGRVAALRDPVTTSFRRWEQQGPVKTILRMWVLRFLYWTGVSPRRLAAFYRDVR